MEISFIGIWNPANQSWFRADNHKALLKRKRWMTVVAGCERRYGWNYSHPLNATRFSSIDDAKIVCDRLMACMKNVQWKVARYRYIERQTISELYPKDGNRTT